MGGQWVTYRRGARGWWLGYRSTRELEFRPIRVDVEEHERRHGQDQTILSFKDNQIVQNPSCYQYSNFWAVVHTNEEGVTRFSLPTIEHIEHNSLRTVAYDQPEAEATEVKRLDTAKDIGDKAVTGATLSMAA